MLVNFKIQSAAAADLEGRTAGKPVFLRSPPVAADIGLTSGGGSLEQALDLSYYSAYPTPTTNDTIAPESVPMMVYRALHPLLRLLQIIGYVGTEIRVNPPAPAGGATFTRGTSPVVIDLAQMEAIPYDVYEPEFVDRPDGKLNLPGAGPEGQTDVFGACVVFSKEGHLSYAGEILQELAMIAQIDPQSILRFGTHWEGGTGFLGINLTNHSQSTFADFVTALEGQVEASIDTYLDAFELGAQARVDSANVLPPDQYTILRPVGPTGLLIDPMNWAHLFRYGEKKGKRKARIKVAEEIGQTIWAYYGQTGAEARKLLRSEAFGDLIVPEANPETGDPDAPSPEPYYQLVSLKKRLVRAMKGTADAAGSNVNLEKFGHDAEKLVGKWAAIVQADISNMESSFTEYHELPPAPQTSEYLSATFTGFVQDGVNRYLIGYKGLPHKGSFDLGGAGFGLRAKVLLSVEGLVAEFIRAWHVNPLQSRRALTLLSGMLYDVRDQLLGSNALRDAVWGVGTPTPNPADNPDNTFSAQISAASNFRDWLNYPEEVFDTLERCKEARALIDRLIQRSAAETRLNDPLVRVGDPGYTQIVLPEEIWETWQSIGVAFAHADRFFLAAEGTDILDILGAYGTAGRKFLEGFHDGLQLDQDEGWEEGYKLAEKWLKSSPISVALQPIIVGGILWGMLKKIGDVLYKTYRFVRDPQAFMDQITKAVDLIFNTPINDLMHALGKGLGETALNEVKRLNKIDNPFHFIFAIGVLLGPIVLEIIISWIVQAYIVVPVLNRARAALVDIFVPVMRSMDGDGLRAAIKLLPDGTDRPNGTIPDLVDPADVPAVPYRSSDPLPEMMPDGTPLPYKPMERSLDDDILEEMLGLKPGDLDETRLAIYRPTEMVPVAERQAMITAMDDVPDGVRTQGLTQDQLDSKGWTALKQRAAEARMMDRRFELDDRLTHARSEIVARPDQMPVMSSNPMRYFDGDQLADMNHTLRYLVNNPELMDYAQYGSIIRLFGAQSDLHIDDQMRVLAGMSKAQIGLADDIAFRRLLNRYATTGNWRLFHILGQNDVNITNAKWGSATFPDGRLNDRMASLLAEAVPNRSRLDELIEPLHYHLKGRIWRAYNDNDLVQDRFATQQAPYANTTINQVEQDILNSLPAATQQLGRDIFNAHGILGWTQRIIGPNGFISRSDRHFNSLPRIVEMWVRRNPVHRTPRDFDEQAAISLGYNMMLRDSNLTTRVHAGHLIAHRHGGPTVGGNMIPMSEGFNVAAYGRIERMTDWALRYYPDNVYVQVEVARYNPTTGLATALRYRAFVPDGNGNPRLLISELMDADLLDPGAVGFD